MEHQSSPNPFSPYQQTILDDLMQRFITLGDTPERARELAEYVLPDQLHLLAPHPPPSPSKG